MKNVIITICLMLVASAAWASGAEMFVPSQYPTIQSAIDAAADGDTVIVAPGTYTSLGNHDIDFLGKAITVRSESGPESCIINYENSARGFYFHNNEGPSSVLNGFTINSGTNYSSQAAIYCDNSNPTITNCIITGYNSWGGISCKSSNAVIKGCLFLSTGGSTAIHTYAPYLDSVFCVIENNIITSSYIGIYLDESYLGEIKGIIRNNVIAGSGTRRGSGIYYRMQHANPTVTGNIITNWAKGINFVYKAIESERKAKITYNNVWDNAINYVSESVPFDLTGLQGNISANPLFIDPSRNDYHLQLGSSCIDTGTDTGVYTDYDGNIRPFDGDNDGLAVSDIGAFEFQDSPAIMVSPVDMTFYAKKNEENPPSQLLSVRNAGTKTLNWQISENCDWLSAQPDSGSSTGEIDSVSLSVDITGLTIGIYTCNLTISDVNACNNPQTLAIRLVINKDVLHVPSECGTIQEAINVAQDGAVIIVAPGTYTSTGNRDIDFLGKAITVRSENGPNNCIIDCNGTEAEPHCGFYFQNKETENSIINGFTITNGYATYGGVIDCEKSSPTIINCTITGNSATEGSGIDCTMSSPTITNCAISNNIGSGICCYHGSNPVITNCTITGNTFSHSYPALGGGIFCYDNSRPVITGCTITGNSTENYGGGIFCNNYSSPKIINCTIAGNSGGDEGGGIYCGYYSSPTITNCIISGNTTWSAGGGIFCDYESSPKITNCTISGNHAEDGGGGIYCYNNSSPIVTNCILWNNTALDGPQIYLDDGSNVSIGFTDVQGGQADVYLDPHGTLNWLEGNIDYDPRFVEPGYWADANNPNIIVEPNDPNAVWIDGDYHLKSEGWSWDIKRSRWTYDDVTSRCIDAGNPGSPLGDELLSVPDDPENIWGQNLRIDMGAFGGTAEASIPPYDWALLVDLTNDGLVDWTDFAYQAADWLNSADQQPGDLNRDNLVDISDLASLVEDWLEQTTWHE